jgi:hypothetical protein
MAPSAESLNGHLLVINWTRWDAEKIKKLCKNAAENPEHVANMAPNRARRTLSHSVPNSFTQFQFMQ